MKSPVVKRSIVIAGHKTSVSLEDAFWRGLKEIANGRELTLSDLVASIDTDRRHGNPSSAIRLFVLDHYRLQNGEDRIPQSDLAKYKVRESSIQFCERTDAAGWPALRGAGAGLTSIGAGRAGASPGIRHAPPARLGRYVPQCAQSLRLIFHRPQCQPSRERRYIDASRRCRQWPFQRHEDVRARAGRLG